MNPENPYEVELRHNQNGDAKYRVGDALVAFNLNDALPDTNGKTVKLTIRKSSNGDKKVDFNYCSRKVLSTDEKVALFVGCFVGVMIYGPFVGKVKPAANQGTLPALTNGRREYAVNPG